MEQLLSIPGQEVHCYFRIGWAERVFSTVSPPDLALLNTDGAALPTFSAKKVKRQP